jgi:hypothetical protein
MKFKALISAAALLTAVGITSPALADLVITSTGGGTGENVLFQNATFSNNNQTITTLTNQGTTFEISSDKQALGIPAQGQARVTGANDAVLVANQTITFDVLGNDVWLESVFNVNAAEDGMIFITATDTDGQVFNGQFDLDVNGENFFNILAINGQAIGLVSFSFDANVTDIRQIRIESGNSVVVPGPIAGAGLPALMALGGFVWARRRKAPATA